MRRHFLRSFLVIALGIGIATILIQHVVLMSITRQVENTPGGTLKLIATLTGEKCAGMSLGETREDLKEKSDAFDMEMYLTGLDDSILNQGILDDLREDGLAIRRVRVGLNHGMTGYIPVVVEGRDLVIVSGPVFKPYGPDSVAWFFLTVLLLTLIVGLSLLVSMPMWRRLRILERTAKMISDGHLDARIPILADDPMVGSVAAQFNTMVTRIEALLASQKMILQAVSHELRTPTARIRFGLEMLEDAETAEEKQRRIESIDEDLAEMDDLVEELLIFNKTEALGISIDVAPVEVARSLEKLVEKKGFLRPGVDVKLDMDDRSIHVMAEHRSFTRAIGNVLSNALRFTNTQVQIIVRREGEFVTVTVCDDGPGVPVAVRDTILQPFKRLDSSRNRKSGGAGLGLAIVYSIISSHGGRIEIRDSEIGGANFVTWWPVA
ncbi:MAG: HAMP domain-containing protein [Holophagae bacterium]|nr:HAMP domain-containing protein [Holophagae bacterium]